MAIKFDHLETGKCYGRKQLAEEWGYRSWEAIARGVVTPRNQNTIVLFVTAQKRSSDTQYTDRFDGETLEMDGEVGHATDARLARCRENGDSVHLFYREQNGLDFLYVGKLELSDVQLRSDSLPSRFVWRVAGLVS